jgi:cation transport protein ChaC
MTDDTSTFLTGDDGGIWVFGYGSLMWNPGFPVQERRVATLAGYHRALCVYSHFHRGTPEAPGLVLGLDRGGACRGVAFRVAAPDVMETVAYLRAREQVTSVYLERQVMIRPDGHAPVTALTYVVDRAHRQYAGRLADDELLRLVRGARGQSGRNPDYVTATQAHLVDLGVHDAVLARLSAALA